jgi:hypothetical protein
MFVHIVLWYTQEDKGTLKQIQQMHLYEDYFNQLFCEDFRRLAEYCLGGKVVGKNLQFFNKVPKVN